MIEFSGCGKENYNLIIENKKNLEKFLARVTDKNQLRDKTSESLEQTISEFGNYSKAISKVVGSATDGLYFSLLCGEFKRGSYIGVTSYSFHASASCILRAGFVPVFIDVDEYGLMDLDKLESVAKKLDGVILVQLFGNTVNEKKFIKICKKFNIRFIEDAAQRHKYSKFLLGSSLSISSVLSFDPNKIFSGIGSGGAVVTKDNKIAQKIDSLRYHGNRCKNKGYNSQLSESSAWIIKKKIEKFDKWNQKRKDISVRYINTLRKFKTNIKTLVNKDNINFHSLHKFVIVFESEKSRNYIETKLLEDKIKTMVHYRYILPELPRFKKLKKLFDFSYSNHLSRHSLSLPIHPFLEKDEVLKITQSLSYHLSRL